MLEQEKSSKLVASGMATAQNGSSETASSSLPPPVPAKEAPVARDELALLVLSSSVTELSMSIQEVNTLVFEIQELRHATSAGPPAKSTLDSANPIEVDAALIKLDAKLETVRAELATVEAQVKPLLDGPSSPAEEAGELGFLRTKWTETLADWDSAQQDAEMLNEELKEDKYLTVFKTVAQQAEDMMKSLEKVLSQSQQFVLDASSVAAKSPSTTSARLPRSPSAPLGSLSASSSSYFPDVAAAQAQLASFTTLHKSLTAKVKYYSPACDRVLKILGKGIADRSTKNGEVLRRYGEMKSRWRNLQERIHRVEAEMRSVEEMLHEAAGQGGSPGPERTRQGEYGSMLTPPRADVGSPGRVSPLRRLANKFSPRSGTPSSALTPPPLSAGRGMTASSSSPSLSTLRSSTATGVYSSLGATSPSGPTPPRPPKSIKRLVSDSQTSSPVATPPRTPQVLSHRRSASAISASVPSATSSVFGTRSARPPSRRPVSPTPSSTAGDRPRWNVSTRRTSEERETLSQSALGGRPSLAGAFPPTSRSGRNSSLGMRPSSRMSLTSSMSRSFGPGAGMRPVSPAFSDASSVAHRERPETPGSRIPMPASAMKRSTTPFSSLDDPEPTSLLQRAMSPTPSHLASSTATRMSLSRSAGPSSSSRSRLPTPGIKSPARAVSPAFSASSSTYGGGTASSRRMSYNRSAPTPEPNLMANAARLSYVRAPPSAGSSSRPPPVPRVPSAYRSAVDPQATPRASSSATFGAPRASTSRPPSSLSTSRHGSSVPSLPPSSSIDSLSSAAGGVPEYIPNALDPLDMSIAALLSTLPLALHTQRIDPPLSRAQAAQLEVFQARYVFALHALDDRRGAVTCKLVDRVGPRARRGEKKVLARVGGGWQDLETHLLGLLATAV
ncbi:hypothetical protein JCM10207_004256 [Rhodosporidiobolus poonsookiae]